MRGGHFRQARNDQAIRAAVLGGPAAVYGEGRERGQFAEGGGEVAGGIKNLQTRIECYWYLYQIPAFFVENHEPIMINQTKSKHSPDIRETCLLSKQFQRLSPSNFWLSDLFLV